MGAVAPRGFALPWAFRSCASRLIDDTWARCQPRLEERARLDDLVVAHDMRATGVQPELHVGSFRREHLRGFPNARRRHPFIDVAAGDEHAQPHQGSRGRLPSVPAGPMRPPVKTTSAPQRPGWRTAYSTARHAPCEKPMTAIR